MILSGLKKSLKALTAVRYVPYETSEHEVLQGCPSMPVNCRQINLLHMNTHTLLHMSSEPDTLQAK